MSLSKKGGEYFQVENWICFDWLTTNSENRLQDMTQTKTKVLLVLLVVCVIVMLYLDEQGCTLVKVLTSHQRGPGTIPVGAMYGF